MICFNVVYPNFLYLTKRNISKYNNSTKVANQIKSNGIIIQKFILNFSRSILRSLKYFFLNTSYTLKSIPIPKKHNFFFKSITNIHNHKRLEDFGIRIQIYQSFDKIIKSSHLRTFQKNASVPSQFFFIENTIILQLTHKGFLGKVGQCRFSGKRECILLLITLYRIQVDISSNILQ